MDDLNMALKLSKGKGNTACQAFTQRGCILRKLGKDDEARADFEAAARLGSPFAKIQVRPIPLDHFQLLRGNYLFSPSSQGGAAEPLRSVVQQDAPRRYRQATGTTKDLRIFTASVGFRDVV
jgi:hypothetical protein